MAVLLAVGVSHALAAEPYVVYTANKFVNGAAVLRTDSATGSTVEISRNGPQGNLFQFPYDLAVEANGSLVVADMGQQNQKDGAVIRVNPITGRQQIVSDGSHGALFYDPAGIVVAPDRTLYVLDSFPGSNGGAVIRVDPDTGAQQLISSDFNIPRLFDLSFGIALDRDGTLVIVNRSLGGELPLGCGLTGSVPLVGSVIRVDPSDGNPEPLAGLAPFPNLLLSYPVGVAVGADGTVVVANECAGGAGLVKVGSGGAQTSITANTASDVLRTPERVAFSPDGDMLVSDYNGGDDQDGGIVKVDHEGAQSLLSSGPLFNHPLGIAVVPNRPPTAALSITPGIVPADRPVTLDASGSSDPEGLQLVYEWDLDGNGTFEVGSGTTPTAMPKFAVNGPKLVRVRVNDPHGGRAVAEGTVDVDASKPVVTGLRTLARVLAVPSRRKRGRASSPTPPRATKLRFQLSEPATVSVALDRARKGRLAKGACSTRAKRGRRCTAWSTARKITRVATAGKNDITLRARGLRPGRYRVVLTATDAMGNRSPRRTLGLRVVRLPR